MSFRTIIPETAAVFFRFLQILPGSFYQFQYYLRIHCFQVIGSEIEASCVRGTVFQISSDMIFHALCYCGRDRFYSYNEFHSSVKSPSFNIFHNRVTDNKCPFSVVDTTFILRRIICIMYIQWVFFLVSAWLLLWDGVLLRRLPWLRIIFNCSPDMISLSFVSIDFVVLFFFYRFNVSNVMISSLYWLGSPVKDLSQCSCSSIRHVEISFSIWWNCFSVMFLSLCVACFRRS